MPAVISYNLGWFLSGNRPDSGGGEHRRPAHIITTVLTLIGWFIAWPAWVLVRCLVAPMTAASQRRYEYEADVAALRIGFGPQLISALHKMSAFEGGRTGFEQAMAATHPPTELRIEALQPARADDWEYQEDELRGPSWREIRRIVTFRKARPSVPEAARESAPA